MELLIIGPEQLMDLVKDELCRKSVDEVTKKDLLIIADILGMDLSKVVTS